jgi:alkylated DNA repair protein (DNA oxidative demethylase)
MVQTGWLPFDEPERPFERNLLGLEAMVLTGFARDRAAGLLEEMLRIADVSPFRHQMTPGGHEMSTAATNCGRAGWITDRRGYRYEPVDPLTGSRWPDMPSSFHNIAAAAAVMAGFDHFDPDACLINRYAPGARLSLHQDRSERDVRHPVVTVSLGLPALFLWGGNERSEPTQTVPLAHGDVMVWGGGDRLRFHGVKELAEGEHPLTGRTRYNLTFRKAL